MVYALIVTGTSLIEGPQSCSKVEEILGSACAREG